LQRFIQKETGKIFHGKAIHSAGGFQRAQLPDAVHHCHRSVRHLRLPHQPQQPVGEQVERDLQSALRAIDAGHFRLVLCLPDLFGSQRQVD
jgi:hypothetical protein